MSADRMPCTFQFRRLDPSFQSLGKSGLARGAKSEQRVWDRYSSDREGLRVEANAIRAAIGDATVELAQRAVDDDDYKAQEGAVVLRLHKLRERDGKLARKKRAKVLAETGSLACEACEFELGERYGAHGDGYIEVHHRRPVSALTVALKTTLADLAMVCANCHRMLHRNGLMRVETLRAQIQSARQRLAPHGGPHGR